MQIAKNTVVLFDYTLTDDSGHVIDSSDGGSALAVLHGSGQIIPGLERELEGKQAGDDFKVSVPPADGYGELIEELRQEVPIEQFEDVEELQPGMQFRVDTDDGPMVITVVEITETIVTVDGNHPLAGQNLHFAVSIREVREATEDELAHGHAHGDGGHSHD